MKKIIASSGKECEVDDWVYEIFGHHTWYCMKDNDFHRTKNNKTTRLAREILEYKLGRKLEYGEQVDHIDQNRLNNKDNNLRLSNSSWNGANRKKFNIKSTSQYIGVSYNKRDKIWRAKIKKDGREFYEQFNSEIEAAKWRDQMAKQLFGGSASLNFP